MSGVTSYSPALLTLLLHLATLTFCHPQCLDFSAPFRPEATLNFCSSFSQLGCCSSNDDNKIREEYEFIRSGVTDAQWEGCYGYIQDILCQKCSPYAADIYDAKWNSKARKFPGLCTNYCNDFYDKCSNIIRLLDSSLPISNSTGDKYRFCKQAALADDLHCYPDLLTNPLLLRELSPAHHYDTNATSGCLCLEPIRDNLANPLWARHAGDGSGRLFVAEQQGRVRIYNTRTKKWNKNCFLDFTNKTQYPAGERGILGIAFHPNYSNNGRFFVQYTTRRNPTDVLPPELRGLPFSFDTKIVISERRVSRSNPNMADGKYERRLLQVILPFTNHTGGEVRARVD
ncbi:hypothetical protein BsWGS_10043 [Bradybaena similaris]